MWAHKDFTLIYYNYDKIVLSIGDGIANKLCIFPDTKFYCLQSYMCVLTMSALTAHKTGFQMSSTCLQILKFLFCCESHNIWLILKIITGFIEPTIRYLHTYF